MGYRLWAMGKFKDKDRAKERHHFPAAYRLLPIANCHELL